jgi:hypothetical protein
MNITIQTIPHDQQRYPTVGDWVWVDDNNLQIRVSHLGDRRYEALVAVHELVEALLCREHGITTEAADAFDKAFEGDGEPGAAADCPYHLEHFHATVIEMTLARSLGVDWDEYDNAVSALP